MALPSVRSRTLTLDWEQEPATLEQTLAQKIESLWSDRILRRGTTAIYVTDAVTGRPLYAVHEDAHLNPASNVKLIATATALDVLGPDWRYLTRLLGPAPRGDDTVPGDVYLVGSHDPTLHTGDLEEMAQALAATGVERILGDLLVGDDPLRDGVHSAVITVEVTGGKPGETPQVTLTPPLPFLDVEVAAKTIKRRGRARLDVEGMAVEGMAGRYRVKVSGTISAGRSATRRHRMEDRGLFTAYLLREALAAAGIELAGGVRRAPLVDYMAESVSREYLPVALVQHESQPLQALVATINKRSVNYLADQLIMSTGAALYGGPPTMDSGVRAMHAWLRERAGIDPAEVLLDTGSGLSYQTELTARQIVRVLRAATGLWVPREPALEPDAQPVDGPDHELADSKPGIEQVFVESLAVGGMDGTLRGRFRDLRGKVQGKTGTLTGVIALSGIVAEGDQALAFSIVTNGNDHRKRNRVRRQHEEIVEALHRYLRSRPRPEAASGDAAASE